MEKRKYATYEIEESLLEQGCGKYIIGVDEVGRGCGAGPVAAGAVWIPTEHLGSLMTKIKDSKVLTEKRRDEMFKLINSTCVWSVQYIDNMIVDEINILNATKIAMEKALQYLKVPKFDHVLIDGTVRLEGLVEPQTQVIRGDSKSISIAAASIVAKVKRDEEMRGLHWVYPQYGWLRNKGYLTKEHIEAIRTYGITDYHRKSFRKVGDYEG
jgi:ribonuclease HII